MTRIYKPLTLVTLVILAGCAQPGVEEKKEALYALRNDMKSLEEQISNLESEIKQLDPSFEAVVENSTLVSVVVAEPRSFEHRFEVRGSIASRRNIMVSAEVPGVVQQIKVREGQAVNKGQVLVVLDAESIRRNIDELKTSLELAQIMFDRQSRLWDQGVGSEIQYLEAKNRKESVERALASAETQLAKATIRAPFSGTVDDVPVKVGELMMTGMPIVRVVSLSSLYIDADVSERFIGKLKKGDKVDVLFPSTDQRIVSRIVAVSDVIDQDNRTFKVEVELDKTEFPVKPNMVVILTMTDYVNEKAVVVPTKIIQRDDIGSFIYTVEDTEGKKVARKLHVETGVSYNSETEVRDGLNTGTVFVDQGFRDLTDGTVIEIAEIQS